MLPGAAEFRHFGLPARSTFVTVESTQGIANFVKYLNWLFNRVLDWRGLGRLKRLVLRALDWRGLRVEKKCALGSTEWLFAKLLSEKVDIVLDIGANAGYSGRHYRSLGYRGPIHSFEPVTDCFHNLENRCRDDPNRNWSAYHVALGDFNGEARINVSGDDALSSSLRESGASLLESAPVIETVRSETVRVRTLSAMLDAGEVKLGRGRVLMKIDVQGSELDVLKGCGQYLGRIAFVKVELSTEELYAGCPLYFQVDEYLRARGFLMIEVEPGWWSESRGKRLQFDAVYSSVDL